MISISGQGSVVIIIDHMVDVTDHNGSLLFNKLYN